MHSLHNIHICNGMHANAVNTIELQCKNFDLPLIYFELQQTLK